MIRLLSNPLCPSFIDVHSTYVHISNSIADQRRFRGNNSRPPLERFLLLRSNHKFLSSLTTMTTYRDILATARSSGRCPPNLIADDRTIDGDGFGSVVGRLLDNGFGEGCDLRHWLCCLLNGVSVYFFRRCPNSSFLFSRLSLVLILFHAHCITRLGTRDTCQRRGRVRNSY